MRLVSVHGLGAKGSAPTVVAVVLLLYCVAAATLLLCVGRAVEGGTHTLFAAVCWQLRPSVFRSPQISAASGGEGSGSEVL